MKVPGEAGRFDFMEVDSRNQRLLAAHKGAGTLALVDLRHGKLLPSVAVGRAQGVAVATPFDVYVVGDEDEHKIAFVSSKTLKPIGEISVDGPVDGIAFDPKNGMAYADEDDGSRIWVIDVQNKKRVATISIPGEPEFSAYDSVTDRIYQNIKTKDSVVVINPQTNRIEAQWSTHPAVGPHGLAIDGKSGRAFVAGRNGKLVGIDLRSGKVFAQAEIAPGTDQIAFASGSRILYCASKGFISVVRETDTGLEALGNVPVHAGAHTLAVDSSRHQIWISFADRESSYLQSFQSAE